jgi:molybdopterin-containing oxidoreductase family iron-sulfur binding subunit
MSRFVDSEGMRDRLSESRGPDYWRSLEELAGSEAFQEQLRREFPEGADLPPEGVDRRRFLQVMGASLALAGAAGCTRQPLETIVPYVRQPEDVIPGRPQYFATAHVDGGYATGVLVENHLGRPTKLEGNLDHPASLGALDRVAQSCLLDLYDPDRAQVVKNSQRIRTWGAFDAALDGVLKSQEGLEGAGLRLLTPPSTSPSVDVLMQQMHQRFPKARWHQWDPVGLDSQHEGLYRALGQRSSLRYDFSRARIVVALDSDFLSRGPGQLRYAHDFMAHRDLEHGGRGNGHGSHPEMNRLYVIESEPTNTGAVADHRLSLSASQVKLFALALAAESKVVGSSIPVECRTGVMAKWLDVIGGELRTHMGESIIIAGESAPPEIHALALAMNTMLNNINKTVIITEPLEVEQTNGLSSIRELVTDMRAGRVDALVMLGGNPVYDAPADLDFAEALNNVAFRAHLSLYDDETSDLCDWHLPMSHDLESWGDARAYDGSVTLLQPMIAPLYRTRSALEILAHIAGAESTDAHDVVQGTWKVKRNGVDFDWWWRKSLHDGFVEGTQRPFRHSTYQREAVIDACGSLRRQAAEIPVDENTFELQFRDDANLRGGRLANNGWLQELPRPWTRLTWENALLLSPERARRLGVQNEDIVEVDVRDRKVEVPVWIAPGHSDLSATLHLGYGRRRCGRVGTAAGADAYSLRHSSHLWSDTRLRVTPTGRRAKLACTQTHNSMEGRHLVRQASLTDYLKDPQLIHDMGHTVPDDMTLYPPDHEYDGYSWGMAFNLGLCTGCNACVTACNAENNIPVVGKDQVLMGREMQWLRIDRYFEGDAANPKAVQQPVMCQHCENAPCEVVCPVGATMHGDEGLNQMVYNRCVGTRYCSNNCPYKVRRFNFFMYSDLKTESLKLMRNPDVTVRTRGVMEKCTYCVQRINGARIQAKKEDRDIRDGEIVTACQQACPTNAIVFGDINDPESRVSKLKASHLNYKLLEDVNTRPRTSYLARVTNPHPKLTEMETSSHGHSGA